jgi:hypothetical protein
MAYKVKKNYTSNLVGIRIEPVNIKIEYKVVTVTEIVVQVLPSRTVLTVMHFCTKCSRSMKKGTL